MALLIYMLFEDKHEINVTALATAQEKCGARTFLCKKTRIGGIISFIENGRILRLARCWMKEKNSRGQKRAGIRPAR